MNNFLTYVSTTGAQAKQISYTILRQAQDSREVGQIMVRTQTTNGSSTSPKDFAFYFGGVKIGGIGNNGTDNVDYATAIRDDGAADGTGAFREGKTTGSSFADFDQNWTAIDPAAGRSGAALRSFNCGSEVVGYCPTGRRPGPFESRNQKD